MKNQAINTSYITPSKIIIKGKINKKNAEIIRLTFFERFNSIITHILIDDLFRRHFGDGGNAVGPRQGPNHICLCTPGFVPLKRDSTRGYSPLTLSELLNLFSQKQICGQY